MLSYSSVSLRIHLLKNRDNGLDDGDEIVLDTNPLVQDTDGDGIIDSKEKFQQTYTHKVKNEDCAVTEVIVDMECTGNINKTTSVESVMNTDILCTDVVGLIGEPFEIETTSEFDTATLTFTIDKSKLGKTEFDNLLFLWYNEEENDFVELETTLDEENSTASIVTTHFSKYMVIDKYKWFEAWAVEFDYNPTGGSSTPDIPVKYNTVLAIDCSGSMDWNDPISTRSGINSADEARYSHTCNRITAAEGFIKYMNSDDETAIVLFTDRANTAAPMTPDKESLKIALQKMYSNGGTSFSAALNASIKQIDSAEKITNGANKNRIILLSDGDDNDYASRRNAAIQKCKDKFIEVYTVGFGSANDAILQNIADKTGGKYYKAMNAQDIVDIFAKFGYMDDFDMTDTDGDGLPDAVEAAGIRLQNGKLLRDVDSDGIIFTDPANPDTDGDGLLDGKEIDPTPQLHTIPEFALPSSSCGPVQSKPSYYFMAISDPRKKDSDGDGYDDIADSNPLFKDYYCFLDNESYSFACVNKKPYPKYKIAQNESGFLSTVEAFGDEFKFLWTANGYVITHVPTSKKLTIDVNGKISLKETNTITDNQLWEVVQYKADNTGIVIKSKVYLLSDGKYYPQYLCYSGEAIAVSNSIDEARLMPVYSSSALPFGYVYMSYLKWIDNGVLVSVMQQTFLRQEEILREQGFDLTDKPTREAFHRKILTDIMEVNK